MPKLAAFFSAYKDVLITVGWVVAAVGWFISNRQANQREKRKETRAEIDAICKAVAEVVLKCRIYYAESPFHEQETARGAEIAFEVHRIVSRTERLQGRVASFFGAVNAVALFFETTTKYPFQSKNRKADNADSQRMTSIEESVHALIDDLEEGFTLAYTNPWRRWKILINREYRNWWPKKVPV